ncbi:restriction endonuclease [Flavobacterium sp. SLB02]|uniref:5-methylcytosine restriction system specificity protein McrC n=1 Tax=Flavobacterium sp. SLB02 TaxID=2665645 RepID=UPI0012AA4D16|nr:restriction endonuclease [Flavobacterium sp. SLB02]QGK73190.1 restriction endonuclease [Flavobacterium sp. SLB02]
MKEKWLFNIIKDNTLVDNQTYQTNNGVFVNHRLKEPISLLRRQGSQWKNPSNDESALWKFLNNTNRKINEALQNNENTALVLFNSKDYEHNTNDKFIDIAGINCMDFTLKTGNLIGYIKNGDYALKISSRFGDNFLKQIIADADGFLELENHGGSNASKGYEWLLIYLWKIKLKKAYRLGLPKSYISKNERFNKVRGQIDPIGYFINGHEGKYNCKYREHSYDNPTTRIIAEVFKKLKGNEFITDLHPIKNALLIATNGCNSKRVDLYNTSHFSNPFYNDYNDVIDLSKLILRDKLSDFGEISDNSAFFFDISMLFEYFIRKQLNKNGIKLESKFEKRFQIPTGISSYKRKLIPDIVMEHNDSFHVFDVKYKAFDFRFGVSRDDLFQIHTYVGQYGNVKNIKSCGFVYPIAESEFDSNKQFQSNHLEEKLNIMGIEISFYIIFLKIPYDKDEKFQEKFQENTNSFVEEIIYKVLK